MKREEHTITRATVMKMAKGKEKHKQKTKRRSITSEGRLEGFPDSSSGRYSAIAFVSTRARRYSATPLLSTA